MLYVAVGIIGFVIALIKEQADIAKAQKQKAEWAERFKEYR